MGKPSHSPRARGCFPAVLIAVITTAACVSRPGDRPAGATTTPEGITSPEGAPPAPTGLDLPGTTGGGAAVEREMVPYAARASVARVAAVDAPQAGPDEVAVAPPICTGIVRRDGTRLVVAGQPVFFFGINAQHLLEPGFPEDEVEPILRDLAARGVNTVRVWFFHDHDPERLARLLDLGGRYGVRFVVVLADNVHRGRDWFFADEDEQKYRPHLQRTVDRFKQRPEVLLWEVVNEPNCGDRFDDECVETIKEWLTMASNMVTALDGCHLVSTGMIGAGNYENELTAFRRIHRRDSIAIVTAHRDSTQDRDREVALAEELDRPIYYGEIYDQAYDEGCGLLEGGKVRRERAERIKDDLRRAIADGVDGYLLWDFAAGRLTRADGRTHDYCGTFGFERDDPLWANLAAAGLPPGVPWRAP